MKFHLARLPSRFPFALIALALALIAGHASAQTFSNPAAITLPGPGASQGPASPYPSSITISGGGTELTAISVTLTDFTHAYPADVDVLLVGPQGQQVMLMSDVGSFFPVGHLNFTFNNTAGASMPSAAALTSGTYAPTNFDPTGNVDGFAPPAPTTGPYGASFASFLGADPNGTWTLYAMDDVSGNDGEFAGGWSLAITTAGNPVLQLNSAVSRKSDGSADFDVDLPLTGTPGIECRSDVVAHALVFTFTNPVVSGNASVTTGSGTTGSPVFSGNTMTVPLTGVTDMQTITVTLASVTDSFAQVLPDTSVSASFLLGDTTANGSVNASDVGLVKSQSGSATSAANFRNDINVNGAINASDVGLAKSTSGNALPPAAASRRP